MDDKKKRILIAEDEPSLMHILTEALSENAFLTIQAKDGEEALLMTLEQHPDLLMLDLIMPKMDGMTVLKKLREDPWGKTLPVIFLTNVNPDSNTILDAIVQHHPAFYFVKSDINLDHIVEKIKEILH